MLIKTSSSNDFWKRTSHLWSRHLRERCSHLCSNSLENRSWFRILRSLHTGIRNTLQAHLDKGSVVCSLGQSMLLQAVKKCNIGKMLEVRIYEQLYRCITIAALSKIEQLNLQMSMSWSSFRLSSDGSMEKLHTGRYFSARFQTYRNINTTIQSATTLWWIHTVPTIQYKTICTSTCFLASGIAGQCACSRGTGCWTATEAGVVHSVGRTVQCCTQDQIWNTVYVCKNIIWKPTWKQISLQSYLSYASNLQTNVTKIVFLVTYGILPQAISICQVSLPCSCRHERIVQDWNTEHHHR